MTQTEMDRRNLERLIAGAKGRERAALDAYTHARIVQDLPAQTRALDALERAHLDVQILDYHLKTLPAEI